MASKKSNYLKSKIVKHVKGEASYTMPTTLYLALYTSDPTVADSGVEVTGGSYSRKSISFAAESGGSAPSNAAINFTSTPTTNVSHWGIRDASSGGNLLYFGNFDIVQAISSGQTFTINSGNLVITEE